MSLTFISTPKRIASKTASVYLTPTPSKRRRVSPLPSPYVRTKHSTKDIFAWTFKADAIATCSVKDVLEMEEINQESMHVFL